MHVHDAAALVCIEAAHHLTGSGECVLLLLQVQTASYVFDINIAGDVLSW